MIKVIEEKLHIEGNSTEVLAELIYAIKKVQESFREHDKEEVFKKVIQDSLETEDFGKIKEG